MMPSPISPRTRSALLCWFDKSARSLPWRRDRDPYRIWVSEVMLQQTTVSTVIPRFEQFMGRFPNLQSLAEADEQEVLQAWQGLGYYSRARWLVRSARMLQETHGDDWPTDPEIWSALPGVGRYILGAVLSQAFEIRLPVLEANTKRLWLRVRGIRTSSEGDRTQTLLWETADAALPRKRIGDFNQAVMELGALVCTVRDPQCGQCPLRSDCQAFRSGRPEQYGINERRPTAERQVEVCLVPYFADQVLVIQRPETGARAGMWEFPHVGATTNAVATKPKTRTTAGTEASIGSTVRRLKEMVGLSGAIEPTGLTVRYTFTRFRREIIVFRLKCRDQRSPTGYHGKSVWMPSTRLTDLPMTTPQRRIAVSLFSPESGDEGGNS